MNNFFKHWRNKFISWRASRNAPKFEEYEQSKPLLLLLELWRGPSRFIRRTYNWVISWSEKKQANYALAGLSFAESSFFPIPPDPLLIAMVIAKPKKWLRLATITTLSSVVGGLFGYFIGTVAIGAVMPLIVSGGYEASYQTAINWFREWGALAVLIAGFTPVPYKIFTIAGGAAGMSLPLFIVGSIVGRGGRFFLVAALMYFFGARYKDKIEKYIDVLGLLFIALVVMGVILIKFLN